MVAGDPASHAERMQDQSARSSGQFIQALLIEQGHKLPADARQTLFQHRSQRSQLRRHQAEIHRLVLPDDAPADQPPLIRGSVCAYMARDGVYTLLELDGCPVFFEICAQSATARCVAEDTFDEVHA